MENVFRHLTDRIHGPLGRGSELIRIPAFGAAQDAIQPIQAGQDERMLLLRTLPGFGSVFPGSDIGQKRFGFLNPIIHRAEAFVKAGFSPAAVRHPREGSVFQFTRKCLHSLYAAAQYADRSYSGNCLFYFPLWLRPIHPNLITQVQEGIQSVRSFGEMNTDNFFCLFFIPGARVIHRCDILKLISCSS